MIKVNNKDIEMDSENKLSPCDFKVKIQIIRGIPYFSKILQVSLNKGDKLKNTRLDVADSNEDELIKKIEFCINICLEHIDD